MVDRNDSRLRKADHLFHACKRAPEFSFFSRAADRAAGADEKRGVYHSLVV